MANGPVIVPLVEAVTLPFEDCISGLNELIALRYAEGWKLMIVLPCPGKNFPGAAEYHWVVIWEHDEPGPG